MPGALGEVADLTGVDDDGGQAGDEQGPDRDLLIVSGRFEDDPLRGQGLGPGDELLGPGGGVGEALAVAGGPRMHVEEIFADIDANPEAAHEELRNR